MQKSNINKSDIISAIFSEISFPFLSLDLQKLKLVMERNLELKSYMAIPIDKKDDKVLVPALRGIIRQINPPKSIHLILNQSKLPFKKHKNGQISPAKSFFTLQMDKDNLVWEESSVWPLAYSSFINQLFDISTFFKFMIEQRINEVKEQTGMGNIDLLSEYNKNMPTEIHNAFASLGAYLGGSTNFEYLSYYATKYQIYRSTKNIAYAEKIKYTKEEAIELDESGIIAIPATLMGSLLPLVKSKNVLGSIPIDEINFVNMPDEKFLSFLQNKIEEIKIPGFIMDKYYRSVFSGLELNNKYALYGKENIQRDHYTDFYKSVSKDELLRCKHYSMPILDVNSVSEIHEIISKIPKRGESGLFFRGQTSFYDLKRSDNVKKLLFGDSASCEPSLITSASRSKFNYDYDYLHFPLKYFLEHEIVFKNYENKKDKKKIFSKLEKMKKSVLCEIDYGVMALAQHYGLPTHGLDVTTSMDVAIWFATNKFKGGDQLASYEKFSIEDWNEDKKKWPIIFVFQNVLNSTSGSLHSCQKLDSLGIKALRPERQSAKFFHGGHTDHQNRLAESLVCAIRLNPNNYETDVDFAYLFPSPEEDIAYKFMLDFSMNDMLSQLDIGREKVARYHEFI